MLSIVRLLWLRGIQRVLPQCDLGEPIFSTPSCFISLYVKGSCSDGRCERSTGHTHLSAREPKQIQETFHRQPGQADFVRVNPNVPLGGGGSHAFCVERQIPFGMPLAVDLETRACGGDGNLLQRRIESRK